MPRVMRAEHSGAIDHVRGRGDRRQDIFVNDDVRYAQLNPVQAHLTLCLARNRPFVHKHCGQKIYST